MATKAHKGGMPAHVPTPHQRDTVRMLAGFGATHPQIARELQLGKSTIERHYKAELAEGHADADLKVVGAMFKMAMSGKNVAATIFWLKNRLGWTDMRDSRMIPPEAPIEHRHEHSLTVTYVFPDGVGMAVGLPEPGKPLGAPPPELLN